MAKIINASIDLKKIDKSKIKQHENGALYYNVTIYVNDEPNKFGQDVSIATSVTKEEREAGIKQVYIGNGKVVKSTEPTHLSAGSNQGEIKRDFHDDLPF